MGNHNVSSEKKTKKSNENQNKKYIKTDLHNENNKNSFLEINTKNSSSYKGIQTILDKNSGKTDKNTNNLPLSYCDSDISDLANNKKYRKYKKISTIFKWKEPAGIVYLTGSFSYWNQLFLMNKKCDKTFEYTIVL